MATEKNCNQHRDPTNPPGKLDKSDHTSSGDCSCRSYSRRDVLIRGGTTLGVAGLAAAGAYWLHDPRGDAGLQAPTPIRLKNYFEKIKPNYPASAPRISAAFGNFDRIDEMVRRSLLGLDPQNGIKRFIAKGDVVCVKPNVGFDRGPELGATTNPDVVRAIVKLCFEAGARKVIVADNPIESPAACFAKSGILKAVERAGGEVMIFSKIFERAVEIRPGQPDASRGEALSSWQIFWRPLERADKVIGVPIIKDHNLCFASMSMKNWYGLLGGRRNQFHQAIHHIISDLGFMMSPTLVIADGTRVMMSSGPTGGRLEDVKPGGITGRPVVVASVDQLALDSWCLQNLLGRDPAALAYLNMAYEKFSQDPGRITAHSWQDYRSQNLIAEVRL
ncbi:MAG: DUF362 domain-containing protein [Phycisphaerae bacterium]|nr:DUF362 domain-containing protein [Phycisphaerae bacterium]